MTRIFSGLLAIIFVLNFGFAHSVSAQQSDDDIVWIQIEAQPNLNIATRSARDYASTLEDVNGFSLGAGWYGIALGPYRRADAEIVLRAYRRDRVIPRDSYIESSDRFRQQFWPVGANVLNLGAAEAPVTAEVPVQDTTPTQAPAEVVVIAPEPEPEPADETLSEARRGERALNRQEKRDLQVALKWAGFYTAAIDGSFGQGTRRSMRAFQEANNFEETGVLTTLQRAALFKQYNAVLDNLGLRMVTNTKAGIEMMMPTSEVSFSKYEPPFAHFDSNGDIGARVLLISQAGDQDTLFGLYDIMQTLEIVPLEGARERKKSSFSLIGQNGRFISETQASLKDGEIKGFTLIWPAGDEERRTRLLAEMNKSFTRIPGVLDPAEGSNDAQAIDLVSGLQIRQPKISRSGFFIDTNGSVVTASEAVQSCTRLTIDGDTDADVMVDDATAGLAVLKPKTSLAPLAVAAFNTSDPRLQSEVSVAGYSYEGVLSAATLTFGTLADVRGLKGEEELSRLALAAQAGDAGGPVFDASGAVMGMLLPKSKNGPQLPEDVSFALDATAIAEMATAAGLRLSASSTSGSIAPRDLRLAAQGMTVLVSCWE
jgi:peptidoglycan hydrolase-like protein with peptidoglycan-binding domain